MLYIPVAYLPANPFTGKQSWRRTDPLAEGAFITGADFPIDGGATASYFYGLLSRRSKNVKFVGPHKKQCGGL